jgi:hypothetical protein
MKGYSMEDIKKLEIGRVKEDGYYITVLRNGIEEQLFYHDPILLNDIVRVGEKDLNLEFKNGIVFKLDSNEEVLIDEYFLAHNKIIENPEDLDTAATYDKVNPYYVESHSIADVYAHYDEKIVDITAKVSDVDNDTFSIKKNSDDLGDSSIAQDSYNQVPTTPNAMSPATPNQVPNNAVPNATPMATPGMVPTATPHQVPNATPNQVPNNAVPNATPMAIPGQVPTATPHQVPNATPGAIPTNAVPKPTPIATPGQVPTATQHQEPKTTT